MGGFSTAGAEVAAHRRQAASPDPGDLKGAGERAHGGESGHRVAVTCGRIVASKTFQTFITVAILLNAVVLALSTYSEIDRAAGDALNVLNEVFLGIFVVELAIRLAAFGTHPGRFFRDGWNVFDFVIITAALLPGVRGSVMLLRLLRLLRIARLATVRDDMRTVLTGMKRSVPAIGTLIGLIFLIIYFYAMVGWALFHEEDPQNWGTIGASALTLFTVATLEGWNEVLYRGEAIQAGAWVYFVTYVLLVSFVLINVLMAFVLNAVEHAAEPEQPNDPLAEEQAEIQVRLRALRRRLAQLEEERAREVSTHAEFSPRDYERVDARLDDLHTALLDLEAELAAQARRHAGGEEVHSTAGERS